MRKLSVPILLCIFFLFHIATVESAKRIVSLDLCTDWMLFHYASQHQSITYSPLLYRYPLAGMPTNLPVHNGSLEQILEIDPELIISGEFNASLLIKRLKQLGKRVKIMPLPVNLQSILNYNDKFQSLVAIHSMFDKSSSIQQHTPRSKTLLILGANGIGAGQGTLENDIIEKSGWTNYLQSQGFVNLDLERIVINPPDAVVWSKPVSNSLANMFANHPVMSGMINQSDSTISDYWRWQCPGPWSFDLVQELAAWKKD